MGDVDEEGEGGECDEDGLFEKGKEGLSEAVMVGLGILVEAEKGEGEMEK